MPKTHNSTYRQILGALALVFLVLGIVWTGQNVLADEMNAPATQTSPLHPAIILLDENGECS